MKTSKTFRIAKFCVYVLLTVAIVIGSVVGAGIATSYNAPLRNYFGTIGEYTENVGTEDQDTQYYKSTYDSKEAVLEAGGVLSQDIVGESLVLLKNDDSALPLASTSKVSVFGATSAMWMMREKLGTKSNDFTDSLKDVGMSVNPTLRRLYSSTNVTYGQGTQYGDGSLRGEWQLGEIPISKYTDDVKNSFASYIDAAIVVISRSGGEGGDIPRYMDTAGGTAGRHYLQLTVEEEDMLRLVAESGFKKTILVFHTSNPFQLDFLDDNIYGIDAVVWVAGTGTYGAPALGKLLTGEIVPSGHLVDTWLKDNYSAAGMQNFGDSRFTVNGVFDASTFDYTYVNYAENIYVDYKYFETRYEDAVTGRPNVGSFNYASKVAYPFGYGLSYTSFDYSGFNMTQPDANGDITVTVKVNNTGSYAGKEVVQLYLQSPYGEYEVENRVEKAAATLVEFVKTPLIPAGGSAEVSMTVNLQDLASYDAYGEGTYILSEGNHYLTAAGNAHEAVNNFLAARGYTTANGMTENGDASCVGTFNIPQRRLMNTAATGAEIVNLFDDATLPGAEYLSRNNWSVLDDWDMEVPGSGINTATGKEVGVSNTTDAAGTIKTIEVPASVKAGLESAGWEASGIPYGKNDTAAFPAITTGAAHQYDLVDMMGLSYDDPAWDALLDQMTVEELHTLYSSCNWDTVAVSSIGKPYFRDADSPCGLENFITSKVDITYPTPIARGSTWNKEIVNEFGQMIGEEAIWLGIGYWYAPPMNIHRNVFSGRNFEYHSADGVLSGWMAANEAMGAQSKGLKTTAKHAALNDQEVNRRDHGDCASFSTEQAIREIYMKTFQIAIEKGNCYAAMSSMARIGFRYAREHYNLNVRLMRGEFGLQGPIITDYGPVSPEHSEGCIAASVSLQLYSQPNSTVETDSAGVQYMLREAAHRTLYGYANGIAMNGIAHGAIHHEGTPVYRLMLLELYVYLGILCASLLFFGGVEAFGKEEKLGEFKAKTHVIKIGIAAVLALVFIAVLVIFIIQWLPALYQAFQVT